MFRHMDRATWNEWLQQDKVKELSCWCGKMKQNLADVEKRNKILLVWRNETKFCWCGETIVWNFSNTLIDKQHAPHKHRIGD